MSETPKPDKPKRARRGRGEASIYQRGEDGRWTGSISLGYDADGKRIRKTVYGETKKAVQDELRRLQNQADAGGIPQAGTMTVAQLLDHWLETMKPAWAAGTHATHSQHVKNQIRPTIGGVRLKLLSTLHVTGMMKQLDEKGTSAIMRRAALVTLRSALGHAVKMKLVAMNAAEYAPLPAKPKHRSEGVTAEQIGKFLEAAAGERLYAMYLLAVDCGLRQGELLGLNWRDLDLESGTVRVNKALEEVKGVLKLKEPKTKSSERTVKMSPLTAAALEEHRKAMLAEGHCTAESPVFCGSRRGQWLRKSDVYRHSFEPILTRAGLKFRFHDLRHASATLLLAGGIDVKTVQARLGHSAAAITMDVYAHALDRGQQSAADQMQAILTRRPKDKKAGEAG